MTKINKGVYFIQTETMGGPIKIGYSNDVHERLKTIQSMSPFKLKVLAILPDKSFDAEARLHQRFQKHRLHGEWFEPHPEIENFIANVNYTYGS